MMEKPVPIKDQFVEKTCTICGLAMQVALKTVKIKWGKSDWKHRDCWIHKRKYGGY